MRRFLGGFLLLALVLVSSDAVAQSSTPTEAKVRELLLVTGAEALGRQVMDSMMEDFSSIYSSVSDRFWEEFRSEIQPDELTTMMVPVYQKHLTAEEVDELIRFFSTPVGRSFIKKQPGIMTDSMKIGADWGERIAERVLEKLESEGVID